MPMTPCSIGTSCCVFVSQRISTWLKWLLSKLDAENVIDTWAESIHQDQDYGFLSDIQHGENFKQIKWENKPNSFKLALSLVIDWLNPRPYSPNTQTLNHLLKPLVNGLVELDSGILIPTYQYPAGQIIRIKLFLVYGEILATKKAGGLPSHSATKFCLFFHAQAPELAHLNLAQRQCEDDTLSAAWALKAAISKNAQEKILKRTGVQWSELNRLAYWDPSQYVVLGMMHNWLEGILQGHFCYQWRFWAISPYEASQKRKQPKISTSQNKREKQDDSYSVMDWDQENESNRSDYSNEDIILDCGPDGGFFSKSDMEQF
ncbi:hypothetical protein O181_064998 [Austropuccinia psidii MF-1]|uniref:Uncharacterized protein n=1 Tax=Austropuccinia psidii MF-1 TaxID=1389203 RepID=A0A9Q3EUK7_9BASI|nr:hypothetical protein [Austropuccinia psidii MF-1]